MQNTNDKLITLGELNTEKYLSSDVAVKKCEELRDSNKKIVLAYGHFDFFHIGHMRFLELAKQEGDILIVCISPDKDLGSEFDETARLQAISIVPSVDYVMVNLFGDIEQLLKNVSPSIYVKGNEFNLLKDPVRMKAFEIEKNACKKANVELVCVDYQGESSTDQINTFLSSFTDELQQYLTMFKQRNDLSQLKQVITNCEPLKVAVIGDTILDEYRYCQPLGTSSKDSILTVQHESSDVFAGGILAIANHVANFSNHVDLFTSVGQNTEEQTFINSQLSDKITKHFIPSNSNETLRKIKYIDQYSLQKIFGVYVMNAVNNNDEDDALYQQLKDTLNRYDVVIVADFGHGTISPKCRELISNESKFLALNTQANAGNKRIHTISRYKSANFISISESELRLDVRDFDADIRPICLESSKRMNTDYLVVTRGHKGSSIIEKSGKFFTIPAFKSNVVDRIGSGDAFLSITSLLASMNVSSEVMGVIGNAVGALAVGIVGNKDSVGRDDLMAYLDSLMNSSKA